MKLTLSIDVDTSCNLQLLDTTTGESGYLSEESEVVKDRFKFTDTVKIYTLQLNKLDSTDLTYSNIQWLQENIYIDVPVKTDGWYTLDYLVIPTKDYVESNMEDIRDLYTLIYCSDGSDIFKLVEGEFTNVPIEELIEVNPENTTISRYTEELVSTCFLEQCYINICKQIFELRGFNKCFKNSVDSQIIYNRDLVWMTINVINYLAEFKEFQEAERLIELFRECNNVCKSEYTIATGNGCGCT